VFGRRKKQQSAEQSAEQKPVYLVVRGTPKMGVQKMLNERHEEGYDLFQVIPEHQNWGGIGANISAIYIFKLREPQQQQAGDFS